jgi:signal transduction histidine kinase
MVKSKRWIFVLFFICLCLRTNAQIHMPDTLKISGPLDEWLGKYLYHYKDSSNLMGPKGAIRDLADGKFSRGKDQLEFYGGQSHSIFWFSLAVKNITTQFQPLFWSFNTSDLDFVLFDISDTNHIILMDSASSHTLLSKRSISVRGVTFRVNLEPGQTKLLLVKVYPLNIDYVNFPSNITTMEDYFLWEKDYASYIFFCLGIFVTALFANICLGVMLKRKIHLWHAVYIFALILWNLNEFMYESLVLPEWIFVYYIKLPKIFFMLFSMLLAMTVFQVFTSQAIRHPLMYKLFKIYKWVVVIVEIILVLSIFPPNEHFQIIAITRMAGELLGILGVFILLAGIVSGILKREKLVMVYAVISLFLILSILNNQLYEWFDITLFNVYPNNLSVSVAVEILLLTVVFAYSRKLEWEKSVQINSDLLNLKTDLSHRIIATQEEERKRIARDLHDDLGGSLAAMKMNFQSMGLDPDKLARIITFIDKASKDVRYIAHNLMPPEFDETKLEDLLKNYYNSINREFNVHFDFLVTGKCENLDKQKTLHIYRILLELSNNIIKHSGAKTATVQLIYYDSNVEIVVEDNGKGFSDNGTQGIGLKNIRSRTDFLQGYLNIDSSRSGTTIMITIPYS